MFIMNSAYSLDNVLAGPNSSSTEYRGINLNFNLSTKSVPSDYSVTLGNEQNKLEFRWNPSGYSASIRTYMLPSVSFNPAQASNGSWSGQQFSGPLSAPYKSIQVKMEVKGDYARVSVGKQEASLVFPTRVSDPSRNVSGWQIKIESRPVLGVATNTTLTNFLVTGDSSSAGSVAVEYFTLTETDVDNKYVEIANPYASDISLNVGQGPSQRRGADFEVVGNRLTWAGYGLDIPSMAVGTVLRVIYYSGAYGSPFYLKVGKRLVGFGGHGE